MNDQLVGGIIAIICVFIGWLPSIIRDKRDRKDRYFFALLQERFKVHQEAFGLAEKLKFNIHSDDDEKLPIVQEVLTWFNRNNLFLNPDLRNRYRKFIAKVENYKLKLEVWRDDYQSKGDAGDNIGKRKELEEEFKEIMDGIQSAIQKDMDIYYDYLK